MTETQDKTFFKPRRKLRNERTLPIQIALIGAAVLMGDGRIFSGCNVENASFGGTVCAERAAIFKAISEGAPKNIKEVLVISDAEKPWPPCVCRQVIAEFATESNGRFIRRILRGK